MYYVYILWSPKSKIFYTGHTEDLKKRVEEHNRGLCISTKPHCPWELVFYSAFRERCLAKKFEGYLKSGSGKSFMYRRLVNVALKKDRRRIAERE